MTVVMRAWPVMVMRVPVDHFRLRWRTTSINGRTVRNLHLDSRMVDAEMIPQLMIHVIQQSLTPSHIHLNNLHMARQRVRLRP